MDGRRTSGRREPPVPSDLQLSSSATIKIALHGMDREMREEYLVVIQAKDMGGHMGGLSGTTTVTVTLTDVNDNPPKFSKSKTSRCALQMTLKKRSSEVQSF